MIWDSLDLPGLGFRVRTADVGRPPYRGEMLLKVRLYGKRSGPWRPRTGTISILKSRRPG